MLFMKNLRYYLLLCHKEGFCICHVCVLSLSKHKFYIHTHILVYRKLIRNFVFYGTLLVYIEERSCNLWKISFAYLCCLIKKKVNVSSFTTTSTQKMLYTYKLWIVAEKFLLSLHVYYTVIINVIIILINITTIVSLW